MARAHGVEAISRLAKKYSGGERFIKLGDGDIVKVAFLGEPFAREVVWINGKTEDFDPDNPDHDPDEARMLASWNCWDCEKEKVRVFDGGVTFFNMWLKTTGRFGLQRYYEIERDGTGKKTQWLLHKDDKIPDDEWADLQGLKLHQLDRSTADEEDEEGNERKKRHRDDDDDERRSRRRRDDDDEGRRSKSSASSNGVIKIEVARDLMQRLKELPMESVDKFLAKFGVERIKDVPSGSTAAAIAFVEALENVGGEEPGQKRAVDPFE